MSNFDERLKRGASSSALAGTTGATLGAAAVAAVCAVGGSIGTITGFLGCFFED